MGYDSLWQVIVTRTFKNALIVFEITAEAIVVVTTVVALLVVSIVVVQQQ